MGSRNGRKGGREGRDEYLVPGVAGYKYIPGTMGTLGTHTLSFHPLTPNFQPRVRKPMRGTSWKMASHSHGTPVPPYLLPIFSLSTPYLLADSGPFPGRSRACIGFSA